MLTKAEHPSWIAIPSPNISGPMPKTVKGFVIHYTAAGSGKNTADYFAKKEVSWRDANGVLQTAKVGVSAHFVIDRDGTVYQCVSLKDKAWHAGKSSWTGKGVNCNDFTIGIELANWGILTKKRDNSIVDWRGQSFPKEKAVEVNKVCWERYPAAQISSLIETMRVSARLLSIPMTMENVTGHENISPGRKRDPGAAFPWQDLRDAFAPKTEEPPEASIWTHHKRHQTEFKS